MRGRERPGTVYWIDHYVICTNDVLRWEAFFSELFGACTLPEPLELRLRRGTFQSIGRWRHGGFVSKAPLPPTLGLSKGLPRYGVYIFASDIDAHLRHLDKLGAPHGDPVRKSDEGEEGVAIYWQDPDGNQFEFWAPDVLPEGAMFGCSSKRIGKISHATFESRDLDRTAAFFARYCMLDPLQSDDIAKDTLVLPLAAGPRLVFRKVDELGGRTTGCGLPDSHTALVIRSEDFFDNYNRLWKELPEWDFDLRSSKPIENPLAQPARTALHVSPAGRRFKELTKRGDDWFDWDTNLFHFYGGTPANGSSLAIYDPHEIDEFFHLWQPATNA